ncbi:MAG: DUF1674 domain-containing protein [Dongiaceae bacterium]
MATPEKPVPKNDESKPTPARRQTGQRPPEIGGPKGPEPTRYDDWEQGGRCSDF